MECGEKTLPVIGKFCKSRIDLLVGVVFAKECESRLLVDDAGCLPLLLGLVLAVAKDKDKALLLSGL